MALVAFLFFKDPVLLALVFERRPPTTHSLAAVEKKLVDVFQKGRHELRVDSNSSRLSSSTSRENADKYLQISHSFRKQLTPLCLSVS